MRANTAAAPVPLRCSRRPLPHHLPRRHRQRPAAAWHLSRRLKPSCWPRQPKLPPPLKLRPRLSLQLRLLLLLLPRKP